MARKKVSKETFTNWKETVWENPTLSVLKLFKRDMGLSDDELRRIITEGNVYKKGMSKADKKFQRDVYNIYKNIFKPEKMRPLQKEQENDPLANLYRIAKETQDPTTLKTEQQQEAIKETAQALLQGLAYEQQQIPQTETQAAAGQTTPQTGGDVVTQAVGNLVGALTQEETEIPEVDIPKGATAEQVKKIRDEAAEKQRQANIVRQGARRLFQTGADIFQQGAPPVERFGGPTGSKLISDYDRLVNLIKPGRTKTQNILAAIAPKGAELGSTIGSGIGQFAGGPLGGLIGAAGGALGGLGIGKGLQYLSRPGSEFESIRNLLAGEKQGIFSPGGRGLADLISGQERRSKLGSLFGLIGPKKPTTRTGRLRQTLGEGVRGIGEFIGEPGRAQQLRNILQIGEALGSIGEDLGINQYARGLAERLGIVSPRRYYPVGGYNNFAGQSIPSALQFIVPEMQRQTSAFYGNPIPAQDVVRRVDAQMRGALAPQIAKQEIAGSRIRGRGQELQARQAAQQIDAETRAALNRLRAQQQGQQFQQKVAAQNLQAREALQRAQIEAQRSRLGAAAAVSGQQPLLQPPLERIPRQPGLEAGLYATGEALQQEAQPILREQVKQWFSKPVILETEGVK